MTKPRPDELVNQLPIAVYTCDKDGYITFYNEAAKNLWGRSPQVGKETWYGACKIFSTDGSPLPRESCPMARTLKSGKPLKGQIVVERADSSRKLVEVYPVPLVDTNNQIVGAMNTMVDVTRDANNMSGLTLASIIESSEDAIISIDREWVDNQLERCSGKYFRLFEKRGAGRTYISYCPS